MTLASMILLAGLVTGIAGLAIWQVLGLAALLRDPGWRDGFSFSIGRQMAAMQRNLQAAGVLGRRTGAGRVANMLLAVSVTCLMAAGVLKVAALIAARQAAG